MRFTILGSGGYFANDRRHTASVLFPEVGVAFDAGSSFFRISSRLKTRTLDVLLTHSHLDHIQGLTYLLVPLLREEIDSCRVHALPHVIEAVKTHLFAGPIFPVLPAVDFVPLTTGVEINGCQITCQPLAHPGGSMGFRISDGVKSVAYITDTTVDGSYTEFIRGVDVLIHECYFPDDRAEWAIKTGHSNTTPVASLAREAGVGRLILTHVDPLQSADDPIGLDVARAVFPNSTLAHDLMDVVV